jgi:UBX domain-containing protein 1
VLSLSLIQCSKAPKRQGIATLSDLRDSGHGHGHGHGDDDDEDEEDEDEPKPQRNTYYTGGEKS